jgi:hypothetical protein
MSALDMLTGRELTGYATDSRGLTLHFGERRLVLRALAATVEVDDRDVEVERVEQEEGR